MDINFDRIDTYCWNIYRGNKQQLVGYLMREQNKPFRFESYNGVMFDESELLKIIVRLVKLNEEITVYV